MLVKNTASINKLMNTYQIPRINGSVIPLYYSDDFAKPR